MSPWIAAAIGVFIGVSFGVALMCALQINRLKRNSGEEV